MVFYLLFVYNFYYKQIFSVHLLVSFRKSNCNDSLLFKIKGYRSVKILYFIFHLSSTWSFNAFLELVNSNISHICLPTKKGLSGVPITMIGLSSNVKIWDNNVGLKSTRLLVDISFFCRGGVVVRFCYFINNNNTLNIDHRYFKLGKIWIS